MLLGLEPSQGPQRGLLEGAHLLLDLHVDAALYVKLICLSLLLIRSMAGIVSFYLGLKQQVSMSSLGEHS